MIRGARADFEKKFITNYKKNPKPFYKYMKSKQITKPTVRQQEQDDGTLAANDSETANNLQDFLISVFTGEDITNIPDIMKKQITVEMKHILIRPDDVLEKMKKLKENKAPGIDKIHPKLLKRCCYILSLPLNMLFNKSLCESRLPQIWKDTNITPIHKKEPKSKADNYRPISLTSIPCKLLDALIKNQLISHLKVNNLISSVQHGFTESRSCLTNHIITLEMITKAIDKDCPVDTIYFDFSKAFDTVPHYRLLHKLKSMGINKNTFLWIKDFQSEQRQGVVIHGVQSQWGAVKSDVPQGSVLGPILVLIYVSDISYDVSSNVILFADDTKLYSHMERQEDCHTLQEDINKLVNWFEK